MSSGFFNTEAGGLLMVIGLMAILVGAGLILPYLLGDSYYFRKWRWLGVFFVIGLVWILLTPHGCQLS